MHSQNGIDAFYLKCPSISEIRSLSANRPRKASACSGNQRFFLQTLKKDVSASFLQSVADFIKQ
ncbi:UNVERIFIED_ORG: hypothetical protein QFZ59_000514 [Bacillus sp. B2I3]|nr:hypothetical protein [Bacillus sp. B2I3]